MSLFTGNSIRKRLISMSLLASSSALLLACTGFVIYELVTFRQTMVRSLTTQAQIVGFNSITPLVFADEQSATQTLAALKAQPSIISAGLYDRAGKLFASYRKASAFSGTVLDPQLTAQVDVAGFEADRLLVFHPIIFEGERLGTVYIESDLRELNERLKQYALIAGLVLLTSLLVAFLISARRQRLISGTVLHLAETAEAVSNRKDYSVRAN